MFDERMDSRGFMDGRFTIHQDELVGRTPGRQWRSISTVAPQRTDTRFALSWEPHATRVPICICFCAPDRFTDTRTPVMENEHYGRSRALFEPLIALEQRASLYLRAIQSRTCAHHRTHQIYV
jgi:hypothetical protein